MSPTNSIYTGTNTIEFSLRIHIVWFNYRFDYDSIKRLDYDSIRGWTMIQLEVGLWFNNLLDYDLNRGWNMI